MKILLLLLVQSITMAAAGSGSISDLIVPAGNFLLIFGFIFFKLKGPLKRMFDENAVKVKELVNLAQEKDKEAQIKLDMYQKKISDLPSEIEQIIANAKTDGETFEKSFIEETDGVIEKITKDSKLKLESEKNNMLKMLNSSLLDEVISKAKGKITADNSLNKKTTDNILSKL